MKKQHLRIIGGCLMATVMFTGTSMADLGSEPLIESQLDALSLPVGTDIPLLAKQSNQSGPAAAAQASVSTTVNQGSTLMLNRVTELHESKIYASTVSSPQGPAGATGTMSSATTPGIWGGFLGTVADQDAIMDKTGFDLESSGLMFGYDAGIDNQTVVGINVSYTSTEVDSGFNKNTKSDVDTYGIGLYASKTLNNNINAMLGVGYLMGEMDTDRTVTAGAVTGVAKSSTDITTYTAYGNIGYDCIHGSLLVTPNIGFNYSNTEVDGYTETGLSDPTANQIVDESDSDLFSTSVGAKLRYMVDNTLSLKGRAHWIHEFSSDLQSTTRSSFAGNPTAFVSTDGIDLDSDRINIGIGMKVNLTSDVVLDVDLDSEYAKEFHSHTGIVKFKYEF